MKTMTIKLYITYKTKYDGVLLMICLLTDNCSDLGQCNCLDKKKPDFSNSFNNNNNQIEKLPKKQKKINMECM